MLPNSKGLGLLMRLLGLWVEDAVGFWHTSQELQTIFYFLRRVLSAIVDWQSHEATDEQTVETIRQLALKLKRPAIHVAGYQPDDFGSHIGLVIPVGQLEMLGYNDTDETRKRLGFLLDTKLWKDGLFIEIVKEILGENEETIPRNKMGEIVLEVPDNTDAEYRFWKETI